MSDPLVFGAHLDGFRHCHGAVAVDVDIAVEGEDFLVGRGDTGQGHEQQDSGQQTFSAIHHNDTFGASRSVANSISK